MRNSSGQCYFVAKILGSCVFMLIVGKEKKEKAIKINFNAWYTDKNGKKIRKYTIVIRVQPKFTLTFPCIFSLNQNHRGMYFRNFPAPLSNSERA
jgi:hypothetical protein